MECEVLLFLGFPIKWPTSIYIVYDLHLSFTAASTQAGFLQMFLQFPECLPLQMNREMFPDSSSSLTVSGDVVSWELLEVDGFKPLLVSKHRPHHTGPRLFEHLFGSVKAWDWKPTGSWETYWCNKTGPDQVTFTRPLQLLSGLVQDGGHHSEERERLEDGNQTIGGNWTRIHRKWASPRAGDIIGSRGTDTSQLSIMSRVSVALRAAKWFTHSRSRFHGCCCRKRSQHVSALKETQETV